MIATGVQYSRARLRAAVRRRSWGIDAGLPRARATAEVGIEGGRAVRTTPNGQHAEVQGRVHVIVRVDPRYFRPAEVDTLQGDATQARLVLGWQPTIGFDELVREMVEHDFQAARRDGVVQRAGYDVPRRHE